MPTLKKGMHQKSKSLLETNPRKKSKGSKEKEKEKPNQSGEREQKLNLPIYKFKNRGKANIFDRLYMPNLVNFNKSDEHCRICPACRKIRNEIEPYKHLLKTKDKNSLRLINQKIIEDRKKAAQNSSSPETKQGDKNKQRTWGVGNKIDEEDTSDNPDHNDDKKNKKNNKILQNNKRNGHPQNSNDNKQRSRDVNNGSPILKETAKFGGDSAVKDMNMFDNPNAILSNGTDSKQLLSSQKHSNDKGINKPDQRDELNKSKTPLPTNSKKFSIPNADKPNKKSTNISSK